MFCKSIPVISFSKVRSGVGNRGQDIRATTRLVVRNSGSGFARTDVGESRSRLRLRPGSILRWPRMSLKLKCAAPLKFIIIMYSEKKIRLTAARED